MKISKFPLPALSFCKGQDQSIHAVREMAFSRQMAFKSYLSGTQVPDSYQTTEVIGPFPLNQEDVLAFRGWMNLIRSVMSLVKNDQEFYVIGLQAFGSHESLCQVISNLRCFVYRMKQPHAISRLWQNISGVDRERELNSLKREEVEAKQMIPKLENILIRMDQPSSL